MTKNFQLPSTFEGGDQVFSIINCPEGLLAIEKIQLSSSGIWRPHVAGTWKCCQMATNFFWLLNFLGAPSFKGTPILIYIRTLTFSFFFAFFSMCMISIVLDN